MKKIIGVIAVTGFFCACNCSNKNMTDNAAAKNMAVQRLFYDEVYNKHNTAMIDSIVAPDYVEHCIEPGYSPDRAGLKKSFDDFAKAMPDMHCQVNFMFADSNYVSVQYTFTGTNTGAMMGMPPTGKKVNIDGVDIIRYRNGKAVGHWGYNEEMKMMTQMGLMPGMGGGSDSAKAK
jgi:steroid delta-isomerase-like uncharacterized protein